MVIAESKPLAEILDMVKDFKKIVVANFLAGRMGFHMKRGQDMLTTRKACGSKLM